VSSDPTDLIPLTVVANETEAEMVRNLLATEGIESMQRVTDFAAGALDGWAAGGAREILVRAEDLDAARELVGDDGPKT
jgi:hypothetical protein